ncbi:MAG: hypothetical protein ACR2N3_19245 [Pyrinomonadaceae bacterium]
MFYTPKYCGECGGEIEPDNLNFKLNRRFCENCEGDYKWQKWLPLIWIIFGAAGIIYGFGSFLKKPEKPVNLVTTRETSANASNKNQSLPNQSNLQVSSNVGVQPAQKTETNNLVAAQENQQTSTNNFAQKTPAIKQNSGENRQNPATEAVYICGAQTKKGTACLRRVKGGGRCWQHQGQPAILPPEKLLVSR